MRLTFLLALMETISSCVATKKVNLSKENIIGEWVLLGRTTANNYVSESNRLTTLVLNKDNTAVFQFGGDYNKEHRGTYTLHGNKIEISTTNGASRFVDSYEMLSLQDNKLEVLARQGNPLRASKLEKLLYEKVID